jgi:hypothetical protein
MKNPYVSLLDFPFALLSSDIYSTTVSHLQDLSFEEACAVLDAQDAMQICDE